jgi:hypothetical protein
VKLPPQQRALVLKKEELRAWEAALFACRGTPAHAWVLDSSQQAAAVQIVLDEVFPAVVSPFDAPLKGQQREQVERAVRQQMITMNMATARGRGRPMNEIDHEDSPQPDTSLEPLRAHGRLLRQGYEATERGVPWFGPMF